MSRYGRPLKRAILFSPPAQQAQRRRTRARFLPAQHEMGVEPEEEEQLLLDLAQPQLDGALEAPAVLPDAELAQAKPALDAAQLADPTARCRRRAKFCRLVTFHHQKIQKAVCGPVCAIVRNKETKNYQNSRSNVAKFNI